PLSEAKEIFRGSKQDALVTPRVVRDADGKVQGIFIERHVGFFESETYLWTGTEAVKLPLPLKTNFQAFVDGAVIFTIEEDWNGRKAGDLLAYDLAAVKHDPQSLPGETHLVVRPAANQTIDNVEGTRNTVVVQLLNDVTGAIDIYHRKGDAWR